MAEKIVPNKQEKENIFGNMIIESEFNSINEENIHNQESLNNSIGNKSEKDDKKVNFISTKTKKHKSQHRKKSGAPLYKNSKSKSSSSLSLNCKEKKNKNTKVNEDDIKLSINNKIDQSNSSFINQSSIEITKINKNINEIKNEKINDNKINEMNIENQYNNEDMNENIKLKSKIDKANHNIENKENEIIKPSLTWKIINSTNGTFVPMEYINEIWDSFIEKEKFNNYSYVDIINKQTDIKDPMRSILVDWLISLQNKFFYNSKTLFLAINLIDRYLSEKQIFRERFQLLGITALFIASKYEEMYMKNINEYVEITAKTFNKYEILEMESQLIDLVNFNLELPLSIDFFGLLGTIYEFSKEEYKLGYFLLEAFLLTLNCCKYKQSQIGLAVCYIILGLRKMYNIYPIKENNFLKYYSNIYQVNFDIWKESNLIIECAKSVYIFYEQKDNIKYREVYYLFRELFI